MNRPGDDGMVAADVEDAVPAQKIEVFMPLAVVEVGPLGPDVHPVEADGALHLDERGIEMLAVQLVVFAHPGRHEGFEVE